MDDDDIRLFVQHGHDCSGWACRILGSRADAEDAVQDCFIKWGEADRTRIATSVAWLSAVCTRRCLETLALRRPCRSEGRQGGRKF